MNNELSNRIKELRKKKGYTQKELANLLGIGQTTVANYEQGTRVPDTDKLNKLADIFDITLDYLLGRTQKTQTLNTEDKGKDIDLVSAQTTFLNNLLEGSDKKARDYIVNLYENGAKMEFIYFDIFKKVLKEVGVLWEKGKVEVWKEHYISECIVDIMREIKFRGLRNTDKLTQSIIALNPGAEMHNIGLRMISDMLETEGWRVIYLGSNVPVSSLIKAIEVEKSSFITISVTMEYHIESAINMITAIKEYFGKNSPGIIIGGLAFANYDKVCEKTGADYYSRNLSDIRDILYSKS